MPSSTDFSLPGSVYTVKLMVQFMSARHVAEGAKVIVIALDTLPSNASEPKPTDVAHDAVVVDAWNMASYEESAH